MTVYPGALDNFAATYGSSVLVGPVVIEHGLAINAMQAEAGVHPSGTYATQTARFDAIQDQSDVYTTTGFSTDRAMSVTAWTLTNVAVLKTFDANLYTTDAMADVLGTLINQVIELTNVVLTLITDLRDRKLVG